MEPACGQGHIASPPVREEWIEISEEEIPLPDYYQSPPVREEWIEIICPTISSPSSLVSSRAGGVD